MPPLRTDLSDGALIARTRRGDRAAYGELWQRHSGSARTVARSFSSLDPGGPQTKSALKQGSISVGLIFSSDAEIGG